MVVFGAIGNPCQVLVDACRCRYVEKTTHKISVKYSYKENVHINRVIKNQFKSPSGWHKSQCADFNKIRFWSMRRDINLLLLIFRTNFPIKRPNYRKKKVKQWNLHWADTFGTFPSVLLIEGVRLTGFVKIAQCLTFNGYSGRKLRKPCCTLGKTLGIIYSLSTAKCIDLPLLIDYSTFFKDVIQYYYCWLIRSAVRLIEVINNKN